MGVRSIPSPEFVRDAIPGVLGPKSPPFQGHHPVEGGAELIPNDDRAPGTTVDIVPNDTSQQSHTRPQLIVAVPGSGSKIRHGVHSGPRYRMVQEGPRTPGMIVADIRGRGRIDGCIAHRSTWRYTGLVMAKRTVSVMVRMSQEEREHADQVARSWGMPLSALVRRLLAEAPTNPRRGTRVQELLIPDGAVTTTAAGILGTQEVQPPRAGGGSVEDPGQSSLFPPPGGEVGGREHSTADEES